MAAEVMGRRALNRATLARQLLLERSTMGPIAAVEHLVGLQAQTTQSWYTTLWSRLEGFDPATFGGLLESRDIVRIAVMRGTIHVLSARDAVGIRPLLQPTIERGARSGHGKNWVGLDLARVTEAARRLLEVSPLTFAELGAVLQEDWPKHRADALAQVARTFLPLVQTPPRGVWGQSGLARHTTVEAWLGRPLDAEPSIDALMLRYLAAFGPASVMDAQAWSGLTRLGEVFERMRPGLVTFRAEAGRELFDLPDAPRPDADTPAPVRFLADYDNHLLGHADRLRTGDYGFFAVTGSVNGVLPGWVLVDGFLRASWHVEAVKAGKTLVVRPLERLTARERSAVEREGLALLRFLDNGATGVRIEAA